jgi:hypothetical protein
MGPEEFTFSKASQWLKQGGRIGTTQITENYSFEDFMQAHSGNVVPLLAIDKKRSIQVFCADSELQPKAGWSVISLYKENAKEQPRDGNDTAEKKD